MGMLRESSLEEDEADNSEDEYESGTGEDGNSGDDVSDEEEEDVDDGASGDEFYEEDGSSDEEQDDNDIIPSSADIADKVTVPVGVEKCSFDLRNLVAINSHQMNVGALYQPASSTHEKFASEEFLLQKASEGCQQLISAIWNLPTGPSDNAGPLAILPLSTEIVHLPRAKPPPPPKVETKWEKFAKLRGIQPKAKRERKVLDEATGEWKYRHGYEKANAKEWPIMEVKRGDDPFADPWEKIRDAKHARTEKNLESRMLNQERAGMLPRGVTKKTLQSRTLARQKGKEGGGSTSAVPKGIPVDLTTGKGTGVIKNTMKRGKELTHAALAATQRSTASLGKFDKVLEGEPERKAPVRKRKFDAVIPQKSASSTETTRGMKVLQTVLNGGAKREKAKRDGSLAKGETAYDYDFDDGLGSGSFRKKKGRAGSGKVRKVTKKRIK